MNRVLDEEAIIRTFWSKLAKGRKDPFDDDVIWSRNLASKIIVSKTDMLVTSTDVPTRMSPAQIARKSIVSCISDFAAKGLKPTFCLVSLGLTRKMSNSSFIGGLTSGFASAQEEYGVPILGGDVNETKFDGVIDCVGVGFADQIVKRRNAKKGDLVGVSGRFGHQAAGLLILSGKAKSMNKSFQRKAVASALNPRARLDLGIKIRQYLSSSIDSSDGLAISLYHLAEASKVSLELDYLPSDDQLELFAKDNKLNVNDLILFGGEEYELVLTYPLKSRNRLSRQGIITIGRVVETRPRSKPQVRYRLKPVPRKGWTHLKGTSLR